MWLILSASPKLPFESVETGAFKILVGVNLGHAHTEVAINASKWLRLLRMTSASRIADNRFRSFQGFLSDSALIRSRLFIPLLQHHTVVLRQLALDIIWGKDRLQCHPGPASAVLVLAFAVAKICWSFRNIEIYSGTRWLWSFMSHWHASASARRSLGRWSLGCTSE